MHVNLPTSSGTFTDHLLRGAVIHAQQNPVVAWIKARHRTHANKALRFQRSRRWLRSIYADPHPFKVIMKGVQVGLTEYALAMMFYLCDQGYAGIYVLPSDDLMKTFVSNRVDTCIANSQWYRHQARQVRSDVSNVQIKRIFGSPVKYVGSNSPGKFLEYPCDFIMMDEYNDCNIPNVTMAYDRQEASEHPSVYIFGNPKRKGDGIHAEYERSDKRRYMQKCAHCNEWQQLDWYANVVEQDDTGHWRTRHQGVTYQTVEASLANGGADVAPLCHRCSGVIDRLEPGEWVKTYDQREYHGYAASRLFGDVTENKRVLVRMFKRFMLAQGDSDLMQHFHNRQLGVPYAAEGSQITLEMLMACQSDYTMPVHNGNPGAVYAGMDIGSVFHLHIEEATKTVPRKRWVGTVRDWDEAAQRCHEHNVSAGCVDSEPEHHGAIEWCRNHPGWYKVRYAGGMKSAGKPARFTIDHEHAEIQCDRTAMLDAEYARWEIGAVQVGTPVTAIDGGDFVHQMTGPVREYDEKSGRYIWTKGPDGQDHHFHASSYTRIAGTLWQEGNIL